MTKTQLKRRNWMAIGLTCFGLTAMIGDLAGSFIVKGIGALSCVAPFPKVFCEMDGVEGFASRFEMQLELESGDQVTIPLTPDRYTQLKGPYNRRNVYGAALAGGPFLPEELWLPVYRHGLKPGGTLHNELELPADTENIRIFIETKTRDRDDSWTFEPKWTL